MSTAKDAIRLRTATVADGAGIWELVRDSGKLDLNSSYAYLLLADRFGDTVVVAEKAGRVVGFVAAFIPPRDPDVVFVWQIGVSEAARGHGLGRRILDHLVELPACRNVRYMETTITPSNEPSQKLFRSFARHRDADVTVSDSRGFATAQFPDGKEAEQLYRIGPFTTGTAKE